MQFYWILFRKCLKILTTYKANFVAFIIQNVLIFLLFIMFFKWAGALSILDKKELVTYYFLLFAFFHLFIPTVHVGFFNYIRTGKLDGLLILPVRWEYYFTIVEASYMFFSFVINFVVFGYIAIFMKNFIMINLKRLPIFILGTIFSLILYFELRLLFTQTAFFLEKEDAMAWWSWFVSRFLSGGILPILIFPEILRRIIYLTPFPYLIDFPISLYLGKQTFTLRHLVFFCGYIVILFAINTKLLKKGLKRYMAYGG